MRLILSRHRHHDSPDKKSHREERKSLKLMKKMAKLEKKLRRYNFNDTSSGNESPTSSRSASRSRSPSRSRNKRTNCAHGKQDFGFYDGSSASDSDSNLSASASSRSLSEHESLRHRKSRSLQRSRSVAGPESYSPVPVARRHYRHRHSYRLQHRDRLRPHHQNGILGCLFRVLARSEPNLQSASIEARNQGLQQNLGSLPKSDQDESNVSDAMPIKANETPEEIRGSNAEVRVGNTERGGDTDRVLSEDSLRIIQNGLPLDKKEYLLRKYRINNNCTLLKGPKINAEILCTARKTAIRRNVLEMYEQNQIGAGLVALGQAISDLDDKTKFKRDKDITDILETLNEAAAIILDTHRDMTIKRQFLMLPELNRRAKSIAKDCKADELLYGSDFGQKVRNGKISGKARRNFSSRISENECDKEETQKHRHKTSERRKKRLDSSGLYKTKQPNVQCES